jgi:uncharacterized membrane protein (DUF485 family)
MSLTNKNDLLNSEEFKKLVSRKWIFSIILTFLMLTVYFGFILTIAYHKELLAAKINKGLTLGIHVGWANKTYDKDVKELKNKILKN